ncbi:tetratricopeptide repeat protein [bacterium]|nr:tetratricopeptide repeat protein [bacterium]
MAQERASGACAQCGAPLDAGASAPHCSRCVARARQQTQRSAPPASTPASPFQGSPDPGRISPGLGPPSVALPQEARIGHYLLVRELGRGGMGVVFRARDTVLMRDVAIKVIHDARLATKAALGRFQREAMATARLHHPGVVSVFETGEHEGRPYIVMELVTGESLEALLARETVEPMRLAALVREVALALEHAHENGIVHRDVKPENVIVDQAGRARLMDFGLAREIGSADRLTATGQSLGTPAYMAPEQAAGDLAAQGPRTDVYGLGGILYRGLAGEPPFQGETVRELLFRVIREDAVPPSRGNPLVPRDLETIALRCLAKDPGSRYPTAAAVALDLARFEEGQAILARPAGWFERSRSWARRNQGLAWALAAIFVLAVGSSGAGVALTLSTVASLKEQREALLRSQREAEERARSNRSRAQALLADAERFHESKDFEAMRVATSRAIELAPEIPRAWYLRGLAREELRDLDGALGDASRAIDLDARSAKSFELRGELHRAKGELEQAEADWARCLELDSRSTAALVGRAAARFRRGDYRGAGADASRATELDGRMPLAWIWRGLSRWKSGEAEGAIADFDRAIELEPTSSMAFTNRGAVHHGRGEVDLAFADFTRAIETDARNVDALLNRGVILDARGDLDSALADYERAVALAPRNAQALSKRGAVRQRKGDHEGAVSDFTLSLEIEPRNAFALSGLGASRLAQQDPKAAIELFDRALAIDPTVVVTYFNRGSAHYVLGENKEAIADYEKVIELAPLDPMAQTARAQLEKIRGPR